MSSCEIFKGNDYQYGCWKYKNIEGYILDLRNKSNKNYCYLHKSTCEKITGYDNKVSNPYTGGEFIKIGVTSSESIKEVLTNLDIPEYESSGKRNLNHCVICDPLDEKYRYNPKIDKEYEQLSLGKFWNNNLGIKRNIHCLLLEFFLGINIIDTISDTTSIEVAFTNNDNRPSNKGTSGLRGSLTKFIPIGILTKLFEKELVKMVRDKFVDTYGFLIIDEKVTSTKLEPWNQTDDYYSRYCVNKRKCHLFTPYRNIINFSWIIVEVVLGFIIQFTFEQIEATVLGIGIMELLKKVRL